MIAWTLNCLLSVNRIHLGLQLEINKNIVCLASYRLLSRKEMEEEILIFLKLLAKILQVLSLDFGMT